MSRIYLVLGALTLVSNFTPILAQAQISCDAVFSDRPANQPVNRFAGQTNIPEHEPDARPLRRMSDFDKLGVIMEPNPKITWMSKDVFNPSARLGDDNKVYLYFRAEDNSGVGMWNGTSRIGIAVSDDGINFRNVKDSAGNDITKPILEPTESWELPGGTEDPRVVDHGNEPAQDEHGQTWRYGMTYTAFDYNHGLARLALAVSNDGITWVKKGLMFKDEDVMKNPCVLGKPWTKSGAMVPGKINGQFVMYFGEGNIRMATSNDGIHWDYPTEEKAVFSRREGYFDQGLVEPGPTPWVDKIGIHLYYHGDGPPHGYQVGEIIFDRNDPSKVIYRSAQPFLRPDQPFEIKGQVGAVVFDEGRVVLNGVEFNYYGAADGKIAVARRVVNKQTTTATNSTRGVVKRIFRGGRLK